MSEEKSSNEISEQFDVPDFPYPKWIQTFNYLFPKKKGAADLFTMENFRRFSRTAPYLTIGLLFIIFLMWCWNASFLTLQNSTRHGILFLVDSALLLVTLSSYLWWVGTSILAKIVKRSAAIPRVMAFIEPLKIGKIAVGFQVIGFIIGQLEKFGS